jgi:hypothetical protein
MSRQPVRSFDLPMEPINTAAVTNVIHKTVLLKGDWQRKVEEHARNGISFVVRPFRKNEHWPELEELCERFDLQPRFVAVDQSAYFDLPTQARAAEDEITYSYNAQIVFR